jgi:hypothetical protein
MPGFRLVFLPLVALAATGMVVPARLAAQAGPDAPCRLCSASAENAPAAAAPAPLRLEVETRLDFDKVVFGGAGQGIIGLSPGGIARLAGAATALGARAMPGSVLVRGEPGRAVTVELPRRVQLFGNGNGSIALDSLVTDLPAFPRIGDDGTLSFRFGGDLKLTGDSDGIYHGTIDILVDYL